MAYRFLVARRIALLLFLLVNAVDGQEKNTAHTLKLSDEAKSPVATIEQFSWLTGYWIGEGFGGVGEEMWSQPMADTMLGTFRLINDGKPSFSEFMMLSVSDGNTFIRLKHFHPDLKGWEKKDEYLEFKLVKVENNSAWFEGLTYQLKDDGTLHVYVAMKQDHGEPKEGKFTFRRKKLRKQAND